MFLNKHATESFVNLNSAQQRQLIDQIQVQIDELISPCDPNDPDLLPFPGVEPPPLVKKILVTTNNIAFVEGTTVTPQAKLTVEPTSDVTVTLTNANQEITVTPTVLTFTKQNYNQYQAFQIEGNRKSSVGDIVTTITLNANGGSYTGVDSKSVAVKLISEGGEAPEESDPLNEAIDAVFTESTKAFGNNAVYTYTNGDLKFDEKSPTSRCTVFTKEIESIEIVFKKAPGWITLFSNTAGDETYGFYGTTPTQFGYITFDGYGSESFSFTNEKANISNFPQFSSSVVKVVYDSKYSCDIFIDNVSAGRMDCSAINWGVSRNDFHPRVGFKIDKDSDITEVLFQIRSVKIDEEPAEFYLPQSKNYGYGLYEKINSLVKNVEYIKNNGVDNSDSLIFKGKKAAVIGDSITADGSFTVPLQNILGLSSLQNLGIGGQGYINGSFDNQVDTITSDTSLIVLAGGINDFRLSIPLGETKDMEGFSSFYSSLYNTFKNVAEKHSDKKIIVALYHNNKEHVHNYPSWNTQNNIGKYSWEYIEAMKQRARMFGFPVADVYGESGINVQDHCTTDGIHLNADGGMRMAEIIKDKILNTRYYTF